MTMKRIMKRKLLPMAVSSAVAAWSGVSYAAGPIDGDWYGLIDLSAEQQQADAKGFDERFTPDNYSKYKDETGALMSNASRVGFKGKTKISDNLKVIYKAEFEMHVDDGISSDSTPETFEQRNIYVGVETPWGTLFGGKHDTPFKLIQDKIDQFNDLTYGDLKNIVPGENRMSNIISYVSPKMAGFQGSVSTILGESSSDYQIGEWDGLASPLTVNQSNEEDNFFDAMSSSVSWENDMFYFAVAADQNMPNKLTFLNVATNPMRINAPGASTFYTPYTLLYDKGLGSKEMTDAVRFVAQIKPVEDVQLGFLYQEGDSSETNYKAYNVDGDATNDLVLATENDYEAYMMSIGWTIGKFVLKAQYGQAEVDSKSHTPGAGATSDQHGWAPLLADGSVEIEQVSLGLDYKLSKNTTMYAFMSDLESEIDSKSLAVATPDAKVDGTASTMGVGFRHKF